MPAPSPIHRLIERFPLQRGAHPSRGDGMCAMEMVAWLAGEPHSDEPRCACPVLAAFVRAANDVMTDGLRNRHLRPLVPMLVNTRANAAVEQVRGYLVLDALVRRMVPAWLARNRRRDAARVLEVQAPIADAAALRLAAPVLELCAPGLRPARWVVQRAVEGMPPARFVAGAVQVARLLGDERAWLEVVRTIAAMADVTRAAVGGPRPFGPRAPDTGAMPLGEFSAE